VSSEHAHRPWDTVRASALWAVALLPLVVFLLPVLRTGYLFDDSFNSYFDAEAHLRGLTFVGYTLKIIHVYIDQEGRFYPLAFLQTYGLLSYTSLYVYKLTLIGLTVLDALLAMFLLRSLNVPRFAVLLFPLAFCATLQMRAFLDPLLGFAGLMQTVSALILGSAILFLGHLRRPRPTILAGSLLLLMLACLEYEAAMGFGVLYPVLALAERRGWRNVARASVPPIVVTIVFLALAVFLRLRAGNNSVYRADLSLGPAVWAFAHQLSGGLPLSYFAASNSLFGHRPAFVEHRFTITGNIAFLAMALVAAAVVCQAARARVAFGAGSAATVGLTGLTIAVAPALLLSISPRWQPFLSFGIAYIPVEVQAIGVAMLITLLGWLAVALRGGRLGAVAVVGAGCLVVVAAASVTFLANDVVVDSFVPAKAERAFEEHALGAGLLNAFPHAASVVPEPFSSYSTQSGFFYKFAHRLLTIAPLSGLNTELPKCGWKYTGACAPYVHPLLYRIGSLPSGREFALACPLHVVGTGLASRLACEGTATVALDTRDRAPGLCASTRIASGAVAPAQLTEEAEGEMPRRGITICRGVLKLPMSSSDVTVVPGP
jgi:hypothetical protein